MTWQQDVLLWVTGLAVIGLTAWLVKLTNEVLWLQKSLNKTLDKMLEMADILKVLVDFSAREQLASDDAGAKSELPQQEGQQQWPNHSDSGSQNTEALCLSAERSVLWRAGCGASGWRDSNLGAADV